MWRSYDTQAWGNGQGIEMRLKGTAKVLLTAGAASLLFYAVLTLYGAWPSARIARFLSAGT